MYRVIKSARTKYDAERLFDPSRQAPPEDPEYPSVGADFVAVFTTDEYGEYDKIIKVDYNEDDLAGESYIDDFGELQSYGGIDPEYFEDTILDEGLFEYVQEQGYLDPNSTYRATGYVNQDDPDSLHEFYVESCEKIG